MTREDVIDKAWNMMVELKEDYTWAKYSELTELISDWNSEHYEGTGDDAEIFMCDDRDTDGYLIGIHLEDDYMSFEN